MTVRTRDFRSYELGLRCDVAEDLAVLLDRTGTEHAHAWTSSAQPDPSRPRHRQVSRLCPTLETDRAVHAYLFTPAAQLSTTVSGVAVAAQGPH